MQQVSYNASNTTVITAGVGYLSTLVFDDEETVLDARPGMEKGWDIKHDANRVYIPGCSINSAGSGENGQQVNQVFEPTSKDWVTNLFIVTTKRYYSVELHVQEAGKPSGTLSYVVSYTYPRETRAKAAKMEAARLKSCSSNKEPADRESFGKCSITTELGVFHE
ncbi:p-type conjugative transfer protein VirB9 [Trichonephila clavipes]|nr:p-type conjugative transfer protein VirB9 [Trichonephila clavipes]